MITCCLFRTHAVEIAATLNPYAMEHNMRAEIEALNTDLKQAFALLRRHL